MFGVCATTRSVDSTDLGEGERGREEGVVADDTLGTWDVQGAGAIGRLRAGLSNGSRRPKKQSKEPKVVRIIKRVGQSGVMAGVHSQK